jgi:hypothetical protein
VTASVATGSAQSRRADEQFLELSRYSAPRLRAAQAVLFSQKGNDIFFIDMSIHVNNVNITRMSTTIPCNRLLLAIPAGPCSLQARITIPTSLHSCSVSDTLFY